jgi:hypothetical protein
MHTRATATLRNGKEIAGYLTTEHAASSYGQPVFMDENRQAYNWAEIENVSTAASELGRKGGSATTEAKQQAARENGRKGGRPRKDKGESPE